MDLPIPFAESDREGLEQFVDDFEKHPFRTTVYLFLDTFWIYLRVLKCFVMKWAGLIWIGFGLYYWVQYFSTDGQTVDEEGHSVQVTSLVYGAAYTGPGLLLLLRELRTLFYPWTEPSERTRIAFGRLQWKVATLPCVVIMLTFLLRVDMVDVVTALETVNVSALLNSTVPQDGALRDAETSRLILLGIHSALYAIQAVALVLAVFEWREIPDNEIPYPLRVLLDMKSIPFKLWLRNHESSAGPSNLPMLYATTLYACPAMIATILVNIFLLDKPYSLCAFITSEVVPLAFFYSFTPNLVLMAYFMTRVEASDRQRNTHRAAGVIAATVLSLAYVYLDSGLRRIKSWGFVHEKCSTYSEYNIHDFLMTLFCGVLLAIYFLGLEAMRLEMSWVVKSSSDKRKIGVPVEVV